MRRIIVRYLKEHVGGMCLYVGFAGVFYVVFHLYGIQEAAVDYAYLLAGFVVFLYGILGTYE